MVTRRLVFVTSIIATAIPSFTLGVIYTHRDGAESREEIASLRAEMHTRLARTPKPEPVSTTGTAVKAETGQTARAKMVAEIKQELQNEMGLLPLNLLRDRRSS